jgi:hypothetical protein
LVACLCPAQPGVAPDVAYFRCWVDVKLEVH